MTQRTQISTASRLSASSASSVVNALRNRPMTDLDRLFREFHEPLVRYLTRRLGDRDWAEEVAQETFLRAMRQERVTSERAWLFAVASNLVRDEARKDARRRSHLELLREQDNADEVEEADVCA